MSLARACNAIAIVLLSASTAIGATLLDPALGFRVRATEHFTIYFHQGEEEQAGRLAGIAEDVWTRVSRQLGLQAPKHTHVILVDQSEMANGWATPLPYDTILVSAAAPGGSDQIGRTDDWLRLVFTHEFTHIVHLDRTAGWARVFRGLFGRTPLAFPNLFLPTWQVEGLAAWEESVLTGQGRLHAGDFRAIEREAARARRFEPIDRVNGGLTDWPGGAAPYAYGLGFHAFLADRFGEPTLGQLAAETSHALPYLGSRAFKRVYGEPLGQLWSDYAQSVETMVSAAAADARAQRLRLTRHGFVVTGPRFARPCTGCSDTIVYSTRNADRFPELRAVRADGSDPRRLTTRYLGSTIGVGNGLLVFDQQELRRNVALYSDLFTYDWSTGRVRALTRGQRLQDPDLSPDGLTIASVREHRGRRDLVLVRLASPSSLGIAETLTLASAPETQFNAPRFSPDGRLIAAERHRPGALSEIITVDVATGAIRAVASDPSARIVTPAWTPDGQSVVAAADYGESTFNLYEYPIDGGSPRRLTATTGGATWPDVSRDGRTIAFVGYTADGFDLFTLPYPKDADTVVGSGVSRIDPSGPAAGTGSGSAAQPLGLTPDPTFVSHTYSPWPTLRPTSWTPVVESSADQWRAGAAVAGADVLGRHAYAASATWLVGAASGVAVSARGTPDWQASYAYDRWQPTLFVSASRDTTFAAGAPDVSGRPTSATLAEYAAEGGVFLPFLHVRRSHAALVSLRRVRDDYTVDKETARNDATAVRLGWTTNTAREYGYSISPEDGITVGATTELLRGSGADGKVTTMTADARAYLPGFAAHHILAIRGATGVSRGNAADARVFHLGGANANGSVMSFDRDAVSLLRGFPADSFAGTHVSLLNVDYRFPLARPERGAGTVPLFLHTLHGSMFADAGDAWTSGFDARRIKLAAGAELAANLVAGYAFPFSLALGGAWGRDGGHAVRGGAAYLRLGVAF